jgi:phosphatidylinositol alpha-1,6-mannosyltransferase
MITVAPAAPRLLLLSSEFPPGPGGIGTHAYQLARHLTARGWAVTVVTAQEYAPAAARAAFNERQPFAVVPLPGREGGRATTIAARLRTIGRAMRAARPDLLLATGRRALWLAAALGPLYRLPVVAVGHGSEFHSDSAVARALTGQAIIGAAAVVAVSDYTAGLVRAAGRPRRLLVIPNAADGDRFGIAPSFSPASPLPCSPALQPVAGRKVLLTVGRVGDRKAQDVVIRALPRVLAAHPDVVYVMAGLPEKQAEFTALAEQLGVGHALCFTGAVDDDALPALYNRADLFVLVSRRTAGGDVEGYGIVVQEAALCGLPAVVSRDCGLTEAIREGETGVSVPPDDPAATGAAIIALLSDDAARARMGRRAHELAARVTWAERVGDYDRLLREVLAATKERGSKAAGEQESLEDGKRHAPLAAPSPKPFPIGRGSVTRAASEDADSEFVTRHS